MKTLLIGFTISSGVFTPEGSTEEKPYNNRVLRFVTDSNENETSRGYDFFSVKLKAETLCKNLNLADDKALNTFLESTLNEEYTLDYAPQNGKMVCVGVSPKKRS